MAKSSQNKMNYIARWNKIHKNRHRYFQYKSRTNTFINKYATRSDLKDLVIAINKRLK